MKYPNIKAIRRQLPYGAMTVIAHDLNVPVKSVSNFFSKGWNSQLTSEILSRAVEIIKSKKVDGDLIKELEELKLTSDFYVPPVSRKEKKNNPGNPEDEIEEITKENLGDLGGWLDKLEAEVENLGYEDESQEFFDDFKELQEDFTELSEQLEDEDIPFEEYREFYLEVLENIVSLQDYLDKNYEPED